MTHAPGERNYHVFYELFGGLSESERAKYGLLDVGKYFYLNQGNIYNPFYHQWVDFNSFIWISKSKWFRLRFRLWPRTTRLGIAARCHASVGHVWQRSKRNYPYIGCCTSLGKCKPEFVRRFYFTHNSMKLKYSWKLRSQIYFHRRQLRHGQEGVELGSDAEVKWAAHLLQISDEYLHKTLTTRVTETRSERLFTPLGIDQALDARDAFAKVLYSGLFNWYASKYMEINNFISCDLSIKFRWISLSIFGFSSWDYQKVAWFDLNISGWLRALIQ